MAKIKSKYCDCGMKAEFYCNELDSYFCSYGCFNAEIEENASGELNKFEQTLTKLEEK